MSFIVLFIQLYSSAETVKKATVIKTQYFGEKFNATNIDAGDIMIHIHIRSPLSFSKDQNEINLQFTIDKVTMSEYSDKDKLTLSQFESLDPNVNHLSRNMSISELDAERIIVENKRKLTMEDIRNLKLDQMPGFQLTWHFNESLVAFKMYEHDMDIYQKPLAYKMFVRYAAIKIRGCFSTILKLLALALTWSTWPTTWPNLA